MLVILSRKKAIENSSTAKWDLMQMISAVSVEENEEMAVVNFHLVLLTKKKDNKRVYYSLGL